MDMIVKQSIISLIPWLLLVVVLGITSLICSIIILVDAFQQEVMQGLLCLCCSPYMLYYAIARFNHEKKGLILVLWLVSGTLLAILQVIVEGG